VEKLLNGSESDLNRREKLECELVERQSISTPMVPD